MGYDNEAQFGPDAFPFERTFLQGVAGVTELLLIRHAEAEYASFEDERGWDPPLTQLGEEQAHRLAQRLYEEGGVSRLYTSPLRRARMTATAIGFELDLPVIDVFDLREVELRRRNGAAAAVAALSPEEIQGQFQTSGRWESFPCAEPSHELRARVRRAVENICATNPRRKVALVTHGGVINAYLADLLGIERDMFFLPGHASLNTVRILGDHRFISRLNDTHHLDASEGSADPLALDRLERP